MRPSMLSVLCVAAALAAPQAEAQTIYPIDRASILAGANFDLKVEFAGLVANGAATVTLNGESLQAVFGRAAEFIEREEGADLSALILRGVSLTKPGLYKVRATDGSNMREVTWEVYGTGPRQAKNVILFIGDGMSNAHRVAARLLSKGMSEGKALGKLAMDDMPAMALVATSGSDSIVTDSANSASAYATGHKSATNAMGVYADRTRDPFDDPKVETIASLVKRRLGLAVGIVTNTEIEDATPAAMIAHTRRRAEYDRIVEQFFAVKPDVLLGGGLHAFTPKGAAGGRRNDNQDFVGIFRDAGYAYASTATELLARTKAPDTGRLLGLFNYGNMDGVLDRRFLKGGTVKKYPDQPDLTEMLDSALQLLSRKPEGFFLMVESGMIDKYTHLLDMERAVYDTIMLDNAVKRAKDWAAPRNDTLILVVADHAHPISLIGTIEDDMTAEPDRPMRERVRTYQQARFPNYPAPDADGYPPRVDVSRRLAMFSASLPDHYATYRPKLDGPNAPFVPGKEPGTFVANEAYKNLPGAVFRLGNISRMMNASVHSVEDVVLTATGPGSERVRGQIDNTEVFRLMAEALGLGHGGTTGQAR
jgi:alkaline phosphatase